MNATSCLLRTVPSSDRVNSALLPGVRFTVRQKCQGRCCGQVLASPIIGQPVDPGHGMVTGESTLCGWLLLVGQALIAQCSWVAKRST